MHAALPRKPLQPHREFYGFDERMWDGSSNCCTYTKLERVSTVHENINQCVHQFMSIRFINRQSRQLYSVQESCRRGEIISFRLPCACDDLDAYKHHVAEGTTANSIHVQHMVWIIIVCIDLLTGFLSYLTTDIRRRFNSESINICRSGGAILC